MSLSDKLRKSVGKKKAEQSPILGVRAEVKKEVAKAFNDFLKEMRKEFAALTQSLKEDADAKIQRHINTRTIEIRGEPGYTPIKGKDYFDGNTPIKGKDYFDGAPPSETVLKPIIEKLIPPPLKGEDGSPDTPEQVVEKVNKSTTKVEVSAISGLQDWLERLRKAAKPEKGGGGGGGMGTVQHELNNVSSATTSISTSYKIAGAGTALWLSYNGQALAKGTDYTVGGDYKTITLLFTPSDATVILVEYIRS